jgi:hypothetical protein
MKVKVRHVGPWGDWLMRCECHDERVTTYSWESAYIAALGHLCMYHPTCGQCLQYGRTGTHWDTCPNRHAR